MTRFPDDPGPGPARAGLRRTADLAWGGLGLSMATASASFAAYMIATAPAEVTGRGSHDFPVFARYDKRVTAPAAVHAPPATAPVRTAENPPAPPGPAPTVAEAAVDPEPTGTIPGPNPADTTVRRASPGRGPLGDYRVRDVFGGHALIEHRDRLSLVKPGSVLAGAGEVLAIERQGRGWIVKTAAGVIGGL